MSRGFMQFRYYGDTNTDNITRNGLKLDEGDDSIIGLINGAKIYRLGIQSLPGCKFYLNKSENAVYIGNTGIFELNFDDSGQTINNIRFDTTWLDHIFDGYDLKDDNNQVIGHVPATTGAYLIIDVAYEVSSSSYQQFLSGEEDEIA